MEVLTKASLDRVERTRLLVKGVVQGVGFRPYVHTLARRFGLNGFVQNGPTGVVIELEGSTAQIEEFLAAFHAEAPPLVKIGKVDRSAVPLTGGVGFAIHTSEAGDAANAAFTLVPPDICVCDECLAETRDPNNRRFDYPFTNCTNCGPRYSIIRDIPYDRPMTTMAGFVMCEHCQKEYDDPEDRRFHAQPNACPVCGPRIRLVGRDGIAWSAIEPREILERVAQLLRAGGIVAWKGLGGYQLACDAQQAGAVEELRKRKRRSDKAFAVMVADVEAAERICDVSEAERAALTSRERPIVLLRRRAHSGLAEAVSPANPRTGVMLPCTPMHDLLFRVLKDRWGNDAALVMTSGNVSEEPIVISEQAAEAQLAGIADVFVHHDRPIHTRVDDSVLRVYQGKPMLLRRARGYAPSPIWLGCGEAEILAAGAQQKSAFCLTKAGFALPSQHLGDLENYETLEFYEETLQRMRKLFHVTPTVVAYDMHPDYLSTKLARKMEGVTHIPVQHHHAHIAACMAEHGLEGRVIGIAWDGTGYGTDGTIWGGEFLAADYVGFDRYAHLRTVPLAGGDTAVREPWRVGRSYLLDAYGGLEDRSANSESHRAIERGEIHRASPNREKVRLVDTLLRRRIHTIETSSCGRLFDAVAALIGLRQEVSFEGQAAMELEAIAMQANRVAEPYPFDFSRSTALVQAPGQVDLRAAIRAILQDIQMGVTKSNIAARFHVTLVNVVVAVCERMRTELDLSRVCLGGGCFQNMLLLDGCVTALRREGFEVFYPVDVPANDGGIALGQAAIAAAWMEQKKVLQGA